MPESLKAREKSPSASEPALPYEGQNSIGLTSPHWAIQLLLSNTPMPPMKLGVDYPNCANLEQALGMFDQSRAGWLPMWFPKEKFSKRWTSEETVTQLSPEERLEWFEMCLEHYAQTPWPPQGPQRLKKRAVALSLLYMCCAAASQKLPTLSNGKPNLSAFVNQERDLPESSKLSREERVESVLDALREAALKAKRT